MKFVDSSSNGQKENHWSKAMFYLHEAFSRAEKRCRALPSEQTNFRLFFAFFYFAETTKQRKMFSFRSCLFCNERSSWNVSDWRCRSLNDRLAFRWEVVARRWDVRRVVFSLTFDSLSHHLFAFFLSKFVDRWNEEKEKHLTVSKKSKVTTIHRREWLQNS